MNTVTINYVEYEIEKVETPEDVEARGLNYLAAEMRKNNIARTLYVRRPNGKRIYHSNEFHVYGKILYSKPLVIA